MMQHKMSQTVAATSHIRLLVDGGLPALCGHSEQHTVQFGSGLFANPDKAIICLLCDFELQAHPLLFSFQFPRISAERLYGETGSKRVFCEGNFSEGENEGARERGRKSASASHVPEVTFDNCVSFFITDTTTRRQIKKLYSN